MEELNHCTQHAQICRGVSFEIGLAFIPRALRSSMAMILNKCLPLRKSYEKLFLARPKINVPFFFLHIGSLFIIQSLRRGLGVSYILPAPETFGLLSA